MISRAAFLMLAWSVLVPLWLLGEGGDEPYNGEQPDVPHDISVMFKTRWLIKVQSHVAGMLSLLSMLKSAVGSVATYRVDEVKIFLSSLYTMEEVMADSNHLLYFTRLLERVVSMPPPRDAAPDLGLIQLILKRIETELCFVP